MKRISKNPDNIAGTELYALKEGYSHQFESIQHTKEGRELILEINASVIDYEDQKAILSINRDVTQRRKAEEMLRQSEERFKLAMEASQDGLWDWNVETDEVYYSPGYWNMLGYQKREFPEEIQSWQRLIHPDDKEKINKANTDCIENRISDFNVEFRMQSKSGNWIWILGRGKAVDRDSHGRATRMIGTHSNITHQKNVEKKLKEREEHFKTLFHKNNSVLMIIDPGTGDIYDVNEKAVYFYGYTRQELKSMNIKDINRLPGDEIRTEINRAIKGEKSYFIFSHRLASGEIKDVEVYSGPLTIEGKKYLYTTIHDITEETKNRRRLQKGEDIAKIGHWEFDLNTNRVFASKGAYKIYGLEKSELTIPEVQQIVTPEYRKYMDKEMKRLIEMGIPYDVEFQIKRPIDHEIRDIHSIAEYNNERNRIFGIIQDITEQKEYERELKKINEELGSAEEELRASNEELRHINQRLEIQKQELEVAKEKAEESDRLKSAFLANMSHEIRTPMNGIMGFSQILHENDFEKEKQKEFLDIIYSRTKHLLQIINDIVDVSKIEANQLSVHNEVIELGELFEELYEDQKNELEELGKYNINLSLSLEDKPLKTEADRNRLKQVMYNLLNNAMKFTHEGTIEFGYKNDRKKEVTFFVSDTGIGIPTQRQGEIFERFRQLDDSSNREYEGTGLGLTISRNLIELMNGTMWVDSEEGRGTTFYFTLPLNNEPINEPDSMSDSTFQQTSLKGKSILLVEDDPTSQEYMKAILEPTGAEIIVSDSGENALEEIYKHKTYDIILMDVRLPGIDGLEVTREIRKKGNKIPIIAQTAHAMGEDRQKCLKAGADDYISKPIEMEQLLTLIHKFLSPA